MSKLAALIGQADNPISHSTQRLREAPVTLARDRLLELEALLHLRDGFVAVDGLLVVRPSVTVASVRGVDEWNQLTLWSRPYPEAREVLFFAEDRFGQQFGLHKDEVVAFDAATGRSEPLAFSLERWAERVQDEPELLQRAGVTAWVQEHGPLSTTQRLQPQVPPSLLDEGAPSSSLRVLEDLDLMRRLARLYKDTREAPGVAPEEFEQWWWDDDA
jgi:hypothetical protein